MSESPRGLAGACIALMVAIVVLACASEGSGRTEVPLATPSPAGEATPAPEPTTTPTEVEDVTLKLMSFNLLWGAGAESRFDENIPARFRGRDRVPELVAFLKQAAPDVLAVEEAAGWDAGEPSLAEQVARELDMSYVLAPDAWELHVVLFSRYPIVEAEYVSRLQDFNGVVLRAKLAVTPEVHVNVIAAHLNSMSSRTRSCQVQAILDIASLLEGRTVLLGDMNFRPEAGQAEALRAGGWQLVAAQERWPIDQVWLDGSGSATESGWWDALRAPEGISDHWPVGVELTFGAPATPASGAPRTVREPVALDYACPLSR
jgi:endonuclease/exonuclease/phosphatase family metal-dependent hydrolase